MRIINCLKIESENDYELIEEHFKRIKEIIDYKKKRIVNYSELSQSLEELEEQINSFLIGLRFEKINQVVKVNDKYINIDNKKIRKLVHDFIFKYRDIRRLNLLLSIYPCISNVKSNN